VGCVGCGLPHPNNKASSIVDSRARVVFILYPPF
jgi:hypothetical protein